MRSFKVLIRELRGFLILWLTQSFSALGSAMTNFALIVWSYQAQLCTHHSAFVRMFLCALCCDEHFRRRSERPLEQKGRYAGQ